MYIWRLRVTYIIQMTLIDFLSNSIFEGIIKNVAGDLQSIVISDYNF